MFRTACVILAGLVLSAGSMSAAEQAPQGNVHPKLKLSFSERFRLVTWDNAIKLDYQSSEGQTFTRHRTSIGGQWYPQAQFELALKLTNEFRYYVVPEPRPCHMDEIIIDQLYVKYTTPTERPVTVTLGRQNIILGEGFLVMDGHPLDGSRSIYFNAARLDWQAGQGSRMTLFYVNQPETDDILPVIHDQETPLIEQPEEGFGLYVTFPAYRAEVQTYLIRKNIDETDARPVSSEINTLGGRVHMPLAERLTGTGEGAWQTGKRGDADRSAFGGYMHFDYATEWRSYLPQTFTLGGIYLSGNDRESDDWESWDPLFSRWPKWSESYIYSQINEDGVAYWSNLTSVYGQVGFVFSPEMSFDFDFHHLSAPERLWYEGRTRGNLYIGKLNFRVNKYTTGHLLWEYFNPGSFYSRYAVDYSWVRVEFLFRV